MSEINNFELQTKVPNSGAGRLLLDEMLDPAYISAEQQKIDHELAPFVSEDGGFDQDLADDVQVVTDAIMRRQVDAGSLGAEDRARNTEYFDRELKAQFYRRRSNSPEGRHLEIAMQDTRAQTLVHAGEAVPRLGNGQLFVTTEQTNYLLESARQQSAGDLRIQDINTQRPGTMEIAVGRIIGVHASFSSWTSGYIAGRKVEDGPSHVERDSAEHIRDYATRPTPIPALDEVMGLMTSDGALYYIANAGAHRAAAAVMKRQETIETKAIQIIPINITAKQIEELGALQPNPTPVNA